MLFESLNGSMGGRKGGGHLNMVALSDLKNYSYPCLLWPDKGLRAALFPDLQLGMTNPFYC